MTGRPGQSRWMGGNGGTGRRNPPGWRAVRQVVTVREPAARSARLLALGVIVGVLAGLSAAGLSAALEVGSAHLVGRFVAPGGPGILHLRWQILLLPALGGLASGLIVLLFARGSRGHSTEELVQSFHHHNGRFHLRGPLVRACASVGVISSGGSAGPEAPIAALGAAIGSSIARYLKMSPRERRILLLAGCAGGVGAIFNCPLGGALFAGSILYREPEFESGSLVVSFVASVVSYSTFMAFHRYGGHLLKHADRLAFHSAVELPVYLALGVACGLTAILFSASMSFVERRSDRMSHVPVWLRPAIGGLLTGLLAMALPQVMDGQYRFVQNALDGSVFSAVGARPDWLFWAVLFGAITVGKCVATAFTLGTGGSGGVLGPAVFMGGLTGAFVGAVVELVAPGIMPEGLRQALIPVGMSGVLAAAMRIPIASMVMVVEMTGSYGLVVPLMLVTTTAYLVGRRWGLIDDQVQSAAESPSHAGDTIVHLLESYVVRDVMDRNWPFVVSPATKLVEILSRLKAGTRPCFAVLSENRLAGIVSVTDILHLAGEPHAGELIIVDDMMTKNPTTIHPTATLYEALRMFRDHDVDVLPVVGDDNGGRQARFLGMLPRRKVHALVKRHVDLLKRHVLREHAVLGVIDEDNKLHELLATMPSSELATIERMPLPPELIGHSLLEAEFRNAYNAEVLAVHTRAGGFLCPPDPQRPFKAGDHLIVLTSKRAGSDSSMSEESREDGQEDVPR